jgi:membrane associated rhomboid family serine protease
MFPLHDDNPTYRTPVLTLLVIAACVVVYFFVQPHNQREDLRFTYEHAAIPCELVTDRPLNITQIAQGRCEGIPGPPVFPGKHVWLAVVVSMFLHGSLLHLVGNMWFLWLFGNNVESYASKLGFVFVYLVSGAAAMAAHVAIDPGSTTPVVGASGAIAGVMGMYLVLWPHARILTLVPFLIFFTVYLPASVVLGSWFVLQFFTGDDSGVAWMAHVGGFVAGVVLGLAWRAVKPPPHPAIYGTWRHGAEGW